jgi:pyrroline-5-carboxylate reductase
MRTGFIGAGNMAQAIIKGLVARKFFRAEDILAADKDQEKLRNFCAAHGIRSFASNEELAGEAEAIVLAVKPDQLRGVLPPLREIVRNRRPLVISIAVGVSLDGLDALLDGKGDVPLVRIMPNVNAQIGLGMAALCGNQAVTPERMDWVESLFAALGRTLRLDEALFPAFSAVACASPAFAFMFIEGLAKGGLKAGLTRQQAVMAAAQAVLGSAGLVLESGQSPCALADTVCSPGGTTIAGVAALEEGAFTAALMRAVAAAVARDREMAAS